MLYNNDNNNTAVLVLYTNNSFIRQDKGLQHWTYELTFQRKDISEDFLYLKIHMLKFT